MLVARGGAQGKVAEALTKLPADLHAKNNEIIVNSLMCNANLLTLLLLCWTARKKNSVASEYAQVGSTEDLHVKDSVK